MGLVLATTAELALVTTILLLLLATPLAWWLARSRRWWKEIEGAVTALPLVLPPTVIGFYVLIALGPASPLMALLEPFGIRTLAFTFTGLVIGSLFYSLPFAIQPLRTAFEAIGDRPMEIAATMGAKPQIRAAINTTQNPPPSQYSPASAPAPAARSGPSQGIQCGGRTLT